MITQADIRYNIYAPSYVASSNHNLRKLHLINFLQLIILYINYIIHNTFSKIHKKRA